MTEYDYPLALTGGLTRSEIITKMHARLDDQRFAHCLRVEECSRQLAARFGEDVDTAGLAGLLHDYAKQIPSADFEKVIRTEGFDQELLQYGRGIWHGMVGVWFIQKELGVSNPRVLRAIERHTTGNPNMTALDMITFTADFIEPARTLDTEVAARKAAETSLRAATLIQLQGTLSYLVGKGAIVHPLTLATYNALIKKEKN